MEDVVVSKIIRMEKRDLEDMDDMVPQCDPDLILRIMHEIGERTDLYPAKREAFLHNVPIFRECYHV